jgi:hypothetical protein
MSNLKRQRSRRWRTRNAVAISVIGATLATGAVTERAGAATPAQHAAALPASAVTAKTTGLLTAAPVPVHGIAADASELNGAFRLRRFQARDGVFYAVGRLTGRLGANAVDETVRLPVTGASNDTSQPQGLQAAPTPGACSILALDLGPLDLNLLGLRVALDEVHLLIEAIPGAGALLGNLLCAVAGLLDGTLGTGLGGLLTNLLTAIVNLLNGLLAA